MGIRIEKSWYFFGSPIVIYPCPNCDHELKSPVADIGKEDACPECHHSFVVPGETQFQIYTALRAKRPNKVDCSPTGQTQDVENTPPSSDGFYKAVILKTHPFNFDREVDDRIRYYSRFKYFAPILNQNPKVVLGVPGNTCPYCEHKLQKKKCVNCGNSYRSRSSVQDYKIWVNIREEWVQPIDEQREIRDGGHAGYLEGVRLREAIKDVLTARSDSGGVISTAWPSLTIENDTLNQATEYLALERERVIYAKGEYWGSYTSAIFQQAAILRDQGKAKEALAKYIEQVYLDLNGPTDFPYSTKPLTPEERREWKRDFKSWDKDFSSADHADEIFGHADSLGLSKNELKDLFIRIATDVKERVKCPLKPLTAFNKVWKEYELYEEQGE